MKGSGFEFDGVNFFSRSELKEIKKNLYNIVKRNKFK